MSHQPVKASRQDVLPANDSGSSVRIDLGDGEEVILVIQPHWLYVLLDRPGVSLFLFASCIGVWFLTDDWLTLLSGSVLLVGWLLWQLAERQSRTYVLTSRRVVAVAGLLRQRVVDAPIQNVRQVTMYKSIPERILGLGSLAFATAGTGGQDVIWRLIERPGERFGQARKLIDPKQAGDSE
jgi:hypothetical protein